MPSATTACPSDCPSLTIVSKNAVSTGLSGRPTTNSRAIFSVSIGNSRRWADLAGRQVDVDEEALHAVKAALPQRDARARLAQHVVSDLTHEAGFLGKRDERAGVKHSLRRVVPARQSLDGNHRAGGQVDNRLTPSSLRSGTEIARFSPRSERSK